ncbi:Ammonium transporter [Nesidiocoris tenuis]|uniref:Ammonium transporter n=1 Tax=Nesidiocoris tenuis TaxID=355587 RepID=A0ABN7ATC0_9HEMI|nr:Ammonium transporter [Nesidiocoris tenuis]
MRNGSEEINATAHSLPDIYNLTIEDSNWIMTAAFIIFTMQTGFGMLESGCVSHKNEMNIMMKNVTDIFLGGITYWAVGYGLSFGTAWTCPFLAIGDFALDVGVHDPLMGLKYTAFLFQLSFATTATTIVSGAMAERCNFKAYCIFSMLNTVVYCIPAGWVWGAHGFLKNLGSVDIAGSGPVHLVGGVSAFASAMMLGPRLGRYDLGLITMPLGTPVNCAMGLFVLWWGWLAFNSGSTYGVSGSKWAFAAKAAVMTMISSFGGGFIGLFYTLYMNKGKANILDIINAVLGSLVAVTAGCFLYNSWNALLIGAIGGAITCFTTPLFDKIGVDDPVGATAVHGMSGIWGVLAVGIFAENPYPLNTTNGRTGLLAGGGWYLLGVQALEALSLGSYSFVSTVFILWLIDKFVPIRMKPQEELVGADLSEHLIRHTGVGVSRAVSALVRVGDDFIDHAATRIVGSNPGHELYLDRYVQMKLKQQAKDLGVKDAKNELAKEAKVYTILKNRLLKETPPMAWME